MSQYKIHSLNEYCSMTRQIEVSLVGAPKPAAVSEEGIYVIKGLA